MSSVLDVDEDSDLAGEEVRAGMTRRKGKGMSPGYDSTEGQMMMCLFRNVLESENG